MAHKGHLKEEKNIISFVRSNISFVRNNIFSFNAPYGPPYGSVITGGCLDVIMTSCLFLLRNVYIILTDSITAIHL